MKAFTKQTNFGEASLNFVYSNLSESLLNSGRNFLGHRRIFEVIQKQFLPPIIKNIYSKNQTKVKVKSPKLVQKFWNLDFGLLIIIILFLICITYVF